MRQGEEKAAEMQHFEITTDFRKSTTSEVVINHLIDTLRSMKITCSWFSPLVSWIKEKACKQKNRKTRCRGKLEKCSVAPSLTSKPDLTWGGIPCLGWLLPVVPSLWTSFNHSSQTSLTREGFLHSSPTTHSAKRWQENWLGGKGRSRQ